MLLLTWAGRGQAVAVTALAALLVHKAHRGVRDEADPVCLTGTGKAPGTRGGFGVCIRAEGGAGLHCRLGLG